MILRSVADVGYILFLVEFLSNHDVKEGRRDGSKLNVTVTLSIHSSVLEMPLACVVTPVFTVSFQKRIKWKE